MMSIKCALQVNVLQSIPKSDNSKIMIQDVGNGAYVDIAVFTKLSSISRKWSSLTQQNDIIYRPISMDSVYHSGGWNGRITIFKIPLIPVVNFHNKTPKKHQNRRTIQRHQNIKTWSESEKRKPASDKHVFYRKWPGTVF